MKPNHIFNFFLFLAIPFVNLAQSKTLYASFSYIKINPGKQATYLNLINTVSPKITAARISIGGGVLGWYMYQVSVPSGASNTYDMVSITVVDDFKLLFDELAPPDNVMNKIFPGASEQTIAGIFEQWEAARYTVKKEIYTISSNLAPGGPSSRYAVVDYVRVPDGKSAEYLRNENFDSFFRDLIKSKTISNRMLYKRNIPIEAADFISICQTDNISNLAESPGDKAVASMEAAKVKIQPIGKVAHREIWELVQYVDEGSIKNGK